MRRDVKLLYDVMADTIGYIQVKMRAASLQLARTHTQFTHCARFARDEIINSLREELTCVSFLLLHASLLRKCQRIFVYNFYFRVQQLATFI